MTQEIVIQLRITVPDGTAYRVIQAPEPDSVLAEPIPPEPGLEAAFVSDVAVPNARRGIAVQQAPAQTWVAGLVHTPGHKPLKPGAKGGLFCPTVIDTAPDGTKTWCSFRA